MRLTRAFAYGLGIAVLLHGTAGTSFGAVTVQAPEIDGSAIPTALAVISAGVLILRARRSK